MNRFKEGIRRGRPQIGFWQALASPYCAEICAGAGFDWLLIDGEHAPNDLPLILSQLQAVASYPVEPIVRLASGDATVVKQLLDFGARTLLIPMVESVEQARHLVRATRYPPDGIRGVGSTLARASRWNRTTDYLRNASDEICLILQIESVAGAEQAEAIAQCDGVDGIFIGPADLAAALGHLGEPAHKEVVDVIQAIIEKVRGCGKAVGILTADEALARHYLALGACFVAVGSDVTVLARGAEALAQRFSADAPAGTGRGTDY